MKITGAKWIAGKLVLDTTDPEALRFSNSFVEGDYQIAKVKKKRSLDANAFAWVLIDKIAAALHLSKEEVYKNAIRDIGGNCEIVCAKTKTVETLKRCWEKQGIGWQIDTMPSRLPKCTTVILYYGSSVYNSRQMSLLIDHLKQDCESLGIEVEPEERIKSLLEAWDKHG